MISNNESTVSIPEREAQQLENVRTEILLGEQKVKQIQAAQRQLQAEIQLKLSEKEQIQSVIDSSKIEEKNLAEEIASLTSEKKSLETDIEEAKTIFVRVSKDITDKENSLTEREISCTERENRLEQDTESHDKASALLAEEKSKHQAKVDKLLEALR